MGTSAQAPGARVVVGAGGTGGAASLALAASGVGAIHVVDGDVVELSNLNRQTQYAEGDIGRPKAEATADRLVQLNSHVVVTSEKRMVTEQAELERLAGDCDVLLLCADQPSDIRAWTNTACLRTGPWVDAGYHGPRVQVCAFVPGAGPCYECLWMREHEQYLELEPQRRYSTQRRGIQAVTAVSAGLSGQLAAHLVTALITGVPAIEPGQPTWFNLAG